MLSAAGELSEEDDVLPELSVPALEDWELEDAPPHAVSALRRNAAQRTMLRIFFSFFMV